MFKCTGSLVALAVVFIAVGCNKGADSVMRRTVDKTKEVVDVLKGVNDEASANAATPKINKIVEDMKALKKEADETKTTDLEGLKKKYQPEMDQVQASMKAEMERISKSNPKAALIVAGALMKFAEIK